MNPTPSTSVSSSFDGVVFLLPGSASRDAMMWEVGEEARMFIFSRREWSWSEHRRNAWGKSPVYGSFTPWYPVESFHQGDEEVWHEGQ